MRFRKAMLLANFFTVCFVLASQSAKATTITNTILIDDKTDTVTVTDPTDRVGPSLSTVPTCGIANVEECALTLSAPPNSTASANTLLSTFLLREPGTIGLIGNGCTGSHPLAPLGCVSDGFASVFTTPSLVTFTVHSDTSVSGQEVLNAPCPTIQPSGVIGCNLTESGGPQLVGSVTWTDTSGNVVIDKIFLESDVSEAPEPSSLILFGSGLVIAAGFLRRRRRLLNPLV